MNVRVPLFRWVLAGVVAAGATWFLIRFTVHRGVPTGESELETVATPAPFELSREPRRSELTKVIRAQLAAFRENDYPEAYTYASTGIRAKFPLAAFEEMVKSQYPGVAKAKSTTIGTVQDNGSQAVANVRIVAESEDVQEYRYWLIKEGEEWKIQGVVQITGSRVSI